MPSGSESDKPSKFSCGTPTLCFAAYNSPSDPLQRSTSLPKAAAATWLTTTIMPVELAICSRKLQFDGRGSCNSHSANALIAISSRQSVTWTRQFVPKKMQYVFGNSYSDAAIAILTRQCEHGRRGNCRQFVLGHDNLNSANAAIAICTRRSNLNMAIAIRNLARRIDDRLINRHAALSLVATLLF